MTVLPTPSRDRLSELFVLLAGITSPSRNERQVADAVIEVLESLGLDVQEDSTGPAIGGNSGNLLCRVGSDSAGPHIALGAHLDTVPVTAAIEVILDQGECFKNANDGILGADDKAAVAALLHATELLVTSGQQFPAYEVFFSVCEEDGLVGAGYLGPDVIASPIAAVIDSSGPVGGIVTSAPSQKIIKGRFKGLCAHAGIEPELGRSAIQAAARAVAAMHLGRLDSETTANIGTINGGTAINVVPDMCEIAGECRGHEDTTLAGVAAAMVDAIHLAAVECEVDVEIELIDEFRGFKLKPDDPVVQLAVRAVSKSGLQPTLQTAGGGSDANVLNAKGIPTVNLSAGMMRVHSAEEYVTLDELERLCSLVLQLIIEAGEGES